MGQMNDLENAVKEYAAAITAETEADRIHSSAVQAVRAAEKGLYEAGKVKENAKQKVNALVEREARPEPVREEVEDRSDEGTYL